MPLGDRRSHGIAGGRPLRLGGPIRTHCDATPTDCACLFRPFHAPHFGWMGRWRLDKAVCYCMLPALAIAPTLAPVAHLSNLHLPDPNPVARCSKWRRLTRGRPRSRRSCSAAASSGPLCMGTRLAAPDGCLLPAPNGCLLPATRVTQTQQGPHNHEAHVDWGRHGHRVVFFCSAGDHFCEQHKS
jgi:hypothetical protein